MGPHIRRSAGVLAAAGVVAWLFIVGCELALPTVADDGHPGQDPDAAGSDADNCVHAFPPPKPGQSATGRIDFLSAFQTATLTNVNETVGLDLDGVCTCSSGPESCTPRIKDMPHCDHAGGRDNEGNAFFGEYLEQALNGTPFGDLDTRIAQGHLGYLVQVKHYNDAPNATGLFVAFYDSSGLYDTDDAGQLTGRSPRWDGGDEWRLDCNLSGANCPATGWVGDASIAPGYWDPEAYVANNVLVAHFSPLVVGVGLTSIRFSHATLVATVTATTGGYRLEGQISGRLSIRDIFSSISTFTTPTGIHLCGDEPGFLAIRSKVCGAADIANDPAKDNVGAPCDALSFTIPFIALPAQLGYRLDHVPPIVGCDGSVDDCAP